MTDREQRIQRVLDHISAKDFASLRLQTSAIMRKSPPDRWYKWRIIFSELGRLGTEFLKVAGGTAALGVITNFVLFYARYTNDTWALLCAAVLVLIQFSFVVTLLSAVTIQSFKRVYELTR